MGFVVVDGDVLESFRQVGGDPGEGRVSDANGSHVTACTASCTSPLDNDISPSSPYSRFAVRRRRSCSWHIPLTLGLFGLPPLADEPDITHCEGGRGQTALISCLLTLSPSIMRFSKSVSPYSRFAVWRRRSCHCARGTVQADRGHHSAPQVRRGCVARRSWLLGFFLAPPPVADVGEAVLLCTALFSNNI